MKRKKKTYSYPIISFSRLSFFFSFAIVIDSQALSYFFYFNEVTHFFLPLALLSMGACGVSLRRNMIRLIEVIFFRVQMKYDYRLVIPVILKSAKEIFLHLNWFPIEIIKRVQ